MQDTQPILVTGAPRSGTTWVGQMLCASGEAGYIFEPTSEFRRPGWAAGRFPHDFQYICKDNESEFIEPLRDILRYRYPLRSQLRLARTHRLAGRVWRDWSGSLVNRLRRSRPLMKDPHAIFSAPWLAERFAAQPIVMIRHPAAVASSFKRLGWHFNFQDWLDQPLLLRDHAGAYVEDMERYRASSPDLIEQSIISWNITYSVVRAYRDTYPGWTFARHEDLAADPLAGFRALYEKHGLTWDSKVESKIRDYSCGDNPAQAPATSPSDIRRDSRAAVTTWRDRLSPEEIERVREGVANLSQDFYTDEEW